MGDHLSSGVTCVSVQAPVLRPDICIFICPELFRLPQKVVSSFPDKLVRTKLMTSSAERNGLAGDERALSGHFEGRYAGRRWCEMPS